MRGLLRERLIVVWAVLVVVTLLSARIGGVTGLARDAGGAIVTTVVLAIAFAKVAAVMFTYMDIRHAPRPLKIVCGAWLVVVFTVLITAYRGVF